MKAGSAGSIPDGDTKVSSSTSNGTAASQASVALHALLRDIGEASFLLNTIVVGLDAVEKGHKKPDELDIFWDPKDRPLAARKARKFAVEGAILRAGEALIEYVKAISAFPRFRSIKAKWDQDTGAAKKLDQIASDVLGKEDFLIAAGMLLVSWRNPAVQTMASPQATANSTSDWREEGAQVIC